MAAQNFTQALAYLLQNERGYVVDNGGPTNLGVTQNALTAWLGRPATVDEVKALTPAAVEPLYAKNYAAPVWFDRLPVGIDYMAFDYCVNSGARQAVLDLQRAAGVPLAQQDGVMGPRTLAAVEAAHARDAAGLVLAYLTNRSRLMLGLNSAVEETNEKGWIARLFQVEWRVQHRLLMGVWPHA